MKRLTTAAGAATALFLLTGLAACGDDAAKDDDRTSQEDTKTTDEASDEPTDEESESDGPEESEDAEGGEAGAAGTKPEWAEASTTIGEVITTIKAGDVTVEVRQAGTAKASKDSILVDSDTKEPLMKAGDPIVYLNFVVTNSGSKPINLSNLLVEVDPRFQDWKYLGGMPSDTASAGYEAQGLSDRAYDSGYDGEVFVFGPGETFSYATNVAYTAGTKVDFDVTYVPTDDKGERISAQRVEAKGTGTLK